MNEFSPSTSPFNNDDDDDGDGADDYDDDDLPSFLRARPRGWEARKNRGLLPAVAPLFVHSAECASVCVCVCASPRAFACVSARDR